jgi:hypothetical protein
MNYAESRKVLGRTIAGFEILTFEPSLNPASVAANTAPAQALAVTGVRVGRIEIKAGVNDRLDIEEATTGAFVASIAAGVYTPDELAAALETAINAEATDNTYVVDHDTTAARVFTIAIDTGTDAFQVFATTGASVARTIAPTIGFTVNTADDTNAKASDTDVTPNGDIAISLMPASLALANLAIGQVWVSDDDEITVTFINTTAGALDAGAQKYTLVVLRPDTSPGPGLS